METQVGMSFVRYYFNLGIFTYVHVQLLMGSDNSHSVDENRKSTLVDDKNWIKSIDTTQQTE